MKCPNKNTDAYKTLKREFGNDIDTLGVISAWQSKNNSDEIPNLDEALTFKKDSTLFFNLKQREFADSVYGNLSRNGIISRLNNNYYIVQSDKTRQFNPNIRQYNQNRLYGYLRANNIPLETLELQPAGKAIKVTLKNNIFTPTDMLPASRSFNTNHSRQVVMHLMRMFPQVNVKMLSPGNAEKLYNSLPDSVKTKVPFSNVRSFYSGDTAILIEGRVTDDAAIEEILHPFIDGVFMSNNTLFNNLLEEVKQNFPQLSQQIEDTYTDKRGFTQKHRDLEKVTQSLSRHFSKEYESTPTKSFMDKVKQFLEWFMDIIKDLNVYFTGKPLTVEAIKETASLSDIAKLLNTSDIKFELSRLADNKVRYNLSPEIKRSLNKAKVGASDMQSKIIDNLFNTAQQSAENVKQLAASADKSIVVLDRENNVYIDLTDPSFKFKGVEEALSPVESFTASLPLQADYLRILEGAINDEDATDIQKDLKKLNLNEFVKMYSDLKIKMQELMNDNDSILLPNVVVFDKSAGVASRIDLLKIDINGVVSPVNITSAITLEDQASQNAAIGLQRRLLVNMGYTVSKANSVLMTSKGFRQVQPSVESEKVQSIVPLNINSESKAQITELLKNSDSRILTDEEILEGAPLTPEQIETVRQAEEVEVIKTTLKDYKKSLIEKNEAIKKIKSKIFMDKTQEDTLENLVTSINLIEVSLAEGDPTELSSTFSQLLMDVISEIKAFKEYVIDPQNFGKPEFITYVLNFDRFMSSFEAFDNINDYKSLNKTQQRLINTFRELKLELRGTGSFLKEDANKDQILRSRGLIDNALYDFVAETYKRESNQVLTEEEIKQILTRVKDIDMLQRTAQDIATSSDPLLAIVDKIYKAKKFEVGTQVEELQEETLNQVRTLQRLDPTGNPQTMFDYMIEDDLTHTKKIGKKYGEQLRKLRSELFDPLGNPLEYRDVANLEDASQEDIDYNIDLAKKKRALADFFQAERVVDGEIVDGYYHKYTDEYKAIRATYEVPLIYKSGYIKWVKKDGISDLDYAVYQSKYKNNIIYNSAEKDGAGEYTGVIMFDQDFNAVKPEFRAPLEVATDPKTGAEVNMRSEKYEAMINDQSALGKARLNFYNYYVEKTEELLDYLPQGERMKMLGKIPTIKRNWAGDLKGKDPIYVKLYGKMSRGFKRFTSKTMQERSYVHDEQGNIVDTMPIFFTGSIQDQADLERIDAEIEALKKERKDGKITLAEYTPVLNKLKEQRFVIEEKPKASEINRDLATSLIMFGQMATHYNTMIGVEDTFRAIQQVIEKRDYLPPESSNIITGITNKLGFKPRGKKENQSTITRMQKWMNMVYYNNSQINKGFFDKVSDLVISGSALSYVAFNVFGNFNNYLLGRTMNGIEVMGQKYFPAEAYARATYEFDKRVLPYIVQRASSVSQKISNNNILYKNYKNMGYYDPNKPTSKYEAFVDYFRMLDNKAEIRESGTGFQSARQSWFSRYVESVGYAFQDAGEYNVQSKIGMSMVIDTLMLNPETNETMSMYDVASFDSITKGLKFKEGFTKIVTRTSKDENGNPVYETIDFTEKWRADTRNKIREVNKQIHGSYAYEDRMAIQSHSLGKLVAQFHKWVMPGFRARYQLEYFDQNLGWMEGRYRSSWQIAKYVLKNLATNGFSYKKSMLNFKIDSAEYDSNRNLLVPGYSEEGTLEFENQVNKYVKEGLTQSQAEARVRQDNQRIDNKIQGYYRTLSETAIILTTFALLTILRSMFDDTDDDDPTVKRLKHYMIFQADRMLDELIIYNVGTDSKIGLIKGTVASARYLKELYEALDVTFSTGVSYLIDSEDERRADSEITYQRGIRRGELKLYKEWQDALPLLGNIKKWRNFIQQQDFYIK